MDQYGIGTGTVSASYFRLDQYGLGTETVSASKFPIGSLLIPQRIYYLLNYQVQDDEKNSSYAYGKIMSIMHSGPWVDSRLGNRVPSRYQRRYLEMLKSSRDNWERLVAAVVKRQQIWELCHLPSMSTIKSDDLSQQTDGFSGSNFEHSSVPPSPLFLPENSSISRAEAYLEKLERFSLHQLQVASNKNMMGEYGSLYKGRLVDGTLVAINRLTTSGELQFRTEIEVFSILGEHRNLLRLRGFCMTSKERFLVYPYMVNGSVASCLRETRKNVQPLDWKTRKRIALGSARGLAYLHDQCDPKIIHRNVKASNILLDEEYEAVVGNFSLAILMDHNDTHVSEGLRGTKGLITPEYLSTRKTSEKTDVYGYGFTLLELITGRTAFSLGCLAKKDGAMLLDWVKGLLKENKLKKLIDPHLRNKSVEGEVEQLIQIALLCAQTSALGRPKMSEVIRLLEGEGLAEKWDEWNKMEELRVQEVEIALRPTFDWINTVSTSSI